MQSRYGVEGGFGGGNTKFRDEFGLSVIDDNKRIFGKKDRDYLDRMNEKVDELTDFFSGERKSFTGKKKKVLLHQLRILKKELAGIMI